MQYRTILVAEVPRVKRGEHGVRTVQMPWAEPGSGFTALFETLVIDWLHEASIKAIAGMLGLSWGAVDRIMQRAVERGCFLVALTYSPIECSPPCASR